MLKNSAYICSTHGEGLGKLTRSLTAINYIVGYKHMTIFHLSIKLHILDIFPMAVWQKVQEISLVALWIQSIYDVKELSVDAHLIFCHLYLLDVDVCHLSRDRHWLTLSFIFLVLHEID